MNEELIKRYLVEKNGEIRIRLLVVIHFLRGRSIRSIADILLIGKDKVHYWIKRYKRLGVEGLNNRKKTGRPPKIDLSQLEAALQGTPEDHGLGEDRWTVDLINQYIVENMGVKINQNYVYQILRKLGWKPQDVGFQPVYPRTLDGQKVSASHLETIREISQKLNAPIQRIITDSGIKPVLNVIYQEKNVTIIEGATENGKLSIKYEEYL